MNLTTPNQRHPICAIATAPGKGGVGVVRLSGDNAEGIAETIAGKLPPARQASLRQFRNAAGESIDDGLLLYFPGPNSFTGESVVEFQGHGGPVVLNMLVEAICAAGAKPAKPGEFSERAFLNDRLDLAQAEAIADLIDAGSAAAAKAAIQSLAGEFSDKVNDLLKQLIALRVHVEAAIDFPEEEIDFLADGAILAQLENVENLHSKLLKSAEQGRVLRDGLTVVLAGRPNAGKSSLLNALTGDDTAIVTDIAGTTRDVLRERIHIDGLPLHIIDTAGLRTEAADAVEAEGIRRAHREIAEADALLLVIDDNDSETAAIGAELSGISPLPAITRIYNKADLSGRSIGLVEGTNESSIAIAAKTGEGMEALREHLKHIAGYQNEQSGQFSARRRHINNLQAVGQNIDNARYQLVEIRAGELVAEELRLAQDQLAEITGQFTSDDLLGEIFSNFCIGK